MVGTRSRFNNTHDKVLVADDPKLQAAQFPTFVQEAINDGRVERGMTRNQVIMSLGYPPTHRTPSLSAPMWTCWYNHWITFTVTFDDAGLVSNVIGPAPTRNEVHKPESPPAAGAPEPTAN